VLFWSITTLFLYEAAYINFITDEEEYVFDEELDFPYFVFPNYNGSFADYIKETLDYDFFYVNQGNYKLLLNLKSNNNEKRLSEIYENRLNLLNYRGYISNDIEVESKLINKFRETNLTDFFTPLNIRSSWTNNDFDPFIKDEFEIFKL
jgi:hypothetical protein